MRLPLDTLPTFRIAAQTESFVQAARVLHLTDSAISHQMKRLEEAVGISLFERHGRTVRLTPAGRLFQATVESTLGSLNETIRAMHRSSGLAGTITIACSSMFGSKWLSRNLADFVRRYPQIVCRLKLVDNERVIDETDADVAVLFGQEPWPGHVVRLLGHVNLSPVCSPRLFSTRDGIPRCARDLTDYPIIHQDDGSEWGKWLQTYGDIDLKSAGHHIYCNDTGFAIDLAYHAGGITLASDELSDAYIAEGSLIRPFKVSVKANGGWYLLSQHHRYEDERSRIFFDWLSSFFERDDGVNHVKGYARGADRAAS